MSAADLANDQDRELTVVTAERDDLQLRLDEAEAVIDAVRKVRDVIAAAAMLAASRTRLGQRVDALRQVSTLLDEVDGL